MSGSLRTGCRLGERGQRQRCEEMIVCSLEDHRRHPEDRFYFRRCRKGCLMVAREDTALQLPNPVNVTRLAFEAALELLLVEPGVVEAAEFRR